MDVPYLMRLAGLLNAGFVLPIGHLTPRNEQALLTVRDEMHQYVTRRDQQTRPPRT